MRVLTVFARPDRRSFCDAVLDRFRDGLKEAGHERRREYPDEAYRLRRDYAD